MRNTAWIAIASTCVCAIAPVALAAGAGVNDAGSTVGDAGAVDAASPRSGARP